MRAKLLLLGPICVVTAGLFVSCGGASRATVHDQDISKVFPWPASQKEVHIRAKPQTTLANTCFLFGSFEDVVVGPDTTFYITDELDKQFAYTPSRSPIRRLAPVKTIEIRWPIPKAEEAGKENAAGQEKSAAKEQPEEKKADAKPEKTSPAQP